MWMDRKWRSGTRKNSGWIGSGESGTSQKVDG